MDIFISWSGERSHQLATALRSWLPNVLQTVRPWMSAHDLKLGSKWPTAITTKLKSAKAGIICLTPENLTEPWIIFEAGALLRQDDQSSIFPYLLDIKPDRLSGPLSFFQAAEANKHGTERLIMALSEYLDTEKLPESVVISSLEKWWPDLETEIIRISKVQVTAERSIINTYIKANQIFDDLIPMIRSTVSEFIFMGTSFHITLKTYKDALLDALTRKVNLVFIMPSAKTDMQQYCKWFGQSPDQLTSEVRLSWIEIEALKKQFPDSLRIYSIDECPKYRMYISDHKKGIIIFYGQHTDSPYLPAFKIDNITSIFRPYYDEVLSIMTQ